MQMMIRGVWAWPIATPSFLRNWKTNSKSKEICTKFHFMAKTCDGKDQVCPKWEPPLVKLHSDYSWPLLGRWGVTGWALRSQKRQHGWKKLKRTGGEFKPWITNLFFLAKPWERGERYAFYCTELPMNTFWIYWDSCCTALLKMTEGWRRSLDNREAAHSEELGVLCLVM